jgi:predicted enzyme related to lactoylglutathione lyase
MEHNMVGWFEIPVTDMERARAFYNTVFNVEIQVEDFGGVLMGWFPFVDGKKGASGALVQNRAYIPDDKKGVLIYFSSGDVNDELSRIYGVGGKLIQPKTLISKDIGYMALFIDSEGNRIALHSRK